MEKRGRPDLRDVPVIVGGGARGVVTTCCYIARLYGVRSAMPMFKARALCPQAVIIKPDMAKYVAVSRQVRALMEALTPLVQPLSIDEAVLDLSGTAALHGAPPAVVLNRFARRVEAELGVTALAKRLASLGISRVGQLAALEERDALRRLGPDGPSLAARARGADARLVSPERESKSVSAETTFAVDLREAADLEAELWHLCEKLGRRLRAEEVAAGGVVLKLKTAGFVSRTRSQRLANPTQLPETLFEAGAALLTREADGTAFRLIGIGAAPLAAAAAADKGDLADIQAARRLARQTAIDRLRARFGPAAVQHGRGLPKTPVNR